jgi:hypothetical protein
LDDKIVEVEMGREGSRNGRDDCTKEMYKCESNIKPSLE